MFSWLLYFFNLCATLLGECIPPLLRVAVCICFAKDANAELSIKTRFCLKVAKQPYFQKVCWITGASSGIGRALAKQIIKSGGYVILSARNTPELYATEQACKRLVKELNPKNNDASDTNVLIVPFDLTDLKSISNAVDIAWNWKQGVDILFNNAGTSSRAPLSTISVDSQLFDLNLLSQILLTKLCLRKISLRLPTINTGDNSKLLFEKNPVPTVFHIVNTASIAAYIGTCGRASYGASKIALIHHFTVLVQEAREILGNLATIHLTNCLPGGVDTNISERSFLPFRSIINESKQLEGQDVKKLTKCKGMTAERCAELMCHAVTMQLSEVWIGNRFELFAVYINQYCPSLWNLLWNQWGLCRLYFRKFMKRQLSESGIGIEQIIKHLGE